MLIVKLLQMFTKTISTPLQLYPFIYFLLAAISLTLLRRWFSNTNSSVPPSPPKLPIIGNLHQLSTLPHRDFHTLSQKYGPIMLLHFGSRPVLVISSAEIASQIMKTHDLIFSDRPNFIFFEKVFYDRKDIVGAPYGKYWRNIRSVSVINLLSNKMVRYYRAVRVEETKLMINSIRESCTKSTSSLSSSPDVVNLSDLFTKLSNNIICRVALGKKYCDPREDGGKMFMKLAGEVTEYLGRVNIGDYIPWLSWVNRLTGFDAEIDDIAKRADAFLDRVVQDHIDKSKGPDGGKNHDDDDDQVIDFVDALLTVQKENSVGIPIDRVSIKATILDMFVAGTDTTFTSIDWVMSELMRNPRVMKKLQNEVRSVVGRKEEVTEDDVVEMHYLKAVIKETFRLRPPVPLLVPKLSREDVVISGYNIKANTQVTVSAWGIGRDPKSYTNPEMFEPERFLNSSIDYIGNDFELIPFGAGRRGCPGLNFAKAIVETVLANVVQKFDWKLAEGKKAEDMDMTESIGMTAHRIDPLKVIARPYTA